MKIDLTPLLNNVVESIEIDEELIVEKEVYKNTDIRTLSPLKLIGSIVEIGERIYNLHLYVSGVMTLPCALSLEDVEHPFELMIDQNVGISDEFEQNYKIISNTLDILPILWENIVLEIPNKIVKENATVKTQGDGWSLVNEGESKNDQLSELKELLDMEEKK